MRNDCSERLNEFVCIYDKIDVGGVLIVTASSAKYLPIVDPAGRYEIPEKRIRKVARTQNQQEHAGTAKYNIRDGGSFRSHNDFCIVKYGNLFRES